MVGVIEAFENAQELVKGFKPMIEEEVKSDRDDIEDFVQDQLFSGVNGRGKPLRPTYTNDPYFKTITKSAKAAKNRAIGYKNYKKRKTPPAPSYLGFPPRNDDTPNLIIRGDFYQSITAKVMNGVLKISTEGLTFGKDIEKKYGSIIFGLSPNARKYLIDYRLNPAIERYLKKFGI